MVPQRPACLPGQQQHQQPRQLPLTEGRRAKIVRLLETKIEKNELKIILLTAQMQNFVNN